MEHNQPQNIENSVQLFYDDNKISQIRLHLKDLNPEIKNKKLIFSHKHFNQSIILFYEKHKTLKNKKIIEYYTNSVLESYFVTIQTNKFKVTKGYSNKGILFSIEKISYNSKKQINFVENWIRNLDGTITTSKEYLN
tara:strand:- start:990 stop:1400 length:411 start_codon:yes stop_codon:yes gene_type:complete